MIMNDTQTIIRVAVAYINSNGFPDLHFLKIRASEDQITHGRHYEAARRWCHDNDFEYKITWDERDGGAGHSIIGIIEEWDEPNPQDPNFIPTIDALPL